MQGIKNTVLMALAWVIMIGLVFRGALTSKEKPGVGKEAQRS